MWYSTKTTMLWNFTWHKKGCRAVHYNISKYEYLFCLGFFYWLFFFVFCILTLNILFLNIFKWRYLNSEFGHSKKKMHQYDVFSTVTFLQSYKPHNQLKKIFGSHEVYILIVVFFLSIAYCFLFSSLVFKRGFKILASFFLKREEI